MSRFYEIDSTRVSHREYWWGTQSPLVLLGWLLKWLHIRIPSSSDDPNTESTLPFVVDSPPPEIAAQFAEPEREFQALGFLDPVYHVIQDPGTRTTVYWATYRHESGHHFARLHHRLWQQAAKSNRGLFPMFFTAFTDGTFLVSSSAKPDMEAPPTVRMNRMYRAPAAQLWEKHRQLADQLAVRKMITPVRSREDVLALTEQHHALVRDFHLTRGVFRPRTTVEQARAETYAARVAEARAGGLEHAEVIAEMQKLQDQKPGWTAAGWVLLISLLLFLALGAARWNWQFTLLLIPVLLFHECGHWLAMRVFHYRNLRMFFIPLFGAAVIGHNWNVPGWKKAVVSLAGPLPGIALGVLLGIVGLIRGNAFLNEAAFLLVFINGFNLLPVLPLDGGHVLHTVLFCRNRWLDVVFRVLAIAGLLALSATGVGRVFLYLAIFMGISLPVAFRLARVTDALRRTPLPPPLPAEDQIPAATAQIIISSLKGALPRGVSNKAIAQHALNVFETLNARPPGILATLGVMAIHGGAFLLVLIFSLVLVIGKNGGLRDFARAAIRQPRHAFHCGGVLHWEGSAARLAAASPHNVLVATFNRRDQAASEFAAVTDQLPSSGRLTLFGETLLLALPAADDAARATWVDRLQSATTNVFVAVSNQPVTLNLDFVAPTMAEATNLAEELGDYLGTDAAMRLIPPWSREAGRPEFAAARHARRQWRQMNSQLQKVVDDPSVAANGRKIEAAVRRGAVAEASRLEQEQRALLRRLQDRTRAQLRAAAATPDEAVLVDLNERLSRLSYTNRAERAAVFRRIATQLGEVKFDGDHPAPGAEAEGASSGLVSRHGLIVEMTWVQLNDPVAGLPALSGWLCEHGCLSVKYDLVNWFAGLDGD